MIDVKETYLTEGSTKGSVFMLEVKEDGTLEMNWYMGNAKTKEENPILVKKSDGSMKLEYGEGNLFGIRRRLPFTDKDGNLEERWTKI